MMTPTEKKEYLKNYVREFGYVKTIQILLECGEADAARWIRHVQFLYLRNYSSPTAYLDVQVDLKWVGYGDL